MQLRNAVSVLTVGHSNHELPRFLDLLHNAGVTAVADVRSRPYSRRLPQFNRAELEAALKTRGIAYVFLGDQLGGRPASADLYNDTGRADYEKMRATEPFRRGMERLCQAAGQHTVAVLCAEADPLDCHRGLMITPALVEAGLAVRHLRKDGTTETQAEFEDRLRAEAGSDDLARGLFADLLTEEENRQLLAEAYRQRARRAAYQRGRDEEYL